MRRAIVVLIGALLALGFVSSPVDAAPKPDKEPPGCQRRSQVYLSKWSPVAQRHARNQSRCVDQEEYLAVFRGSGDSWTSTGTLTLFAPEGTSVAKTFEVRMEDGSNQEVTLVCGPTGPSGVAECPQTFEGRIFAGAPVTNVFTTADGRTIITTGESFCDNPTPVGEICR